MAYDGKYRTTPDHHQNMDSNDLKRSYTAGYGADDLARARSPPTMREGAYPALHHPSEPARPRSRQSSKDRGDGYASKSARYPQPQQPINEAVSSALHDKGDMSSSISPEMLAQITESVIKQLQSANLNGGPAMPPQPQYYPPPLVPLHQPIPTQQPVPLSPSTTLSGNSPPNHTRNVYTPPSPHKHPDYVIVGSHNPTPEPSTYTQPPSPPRQSYVPQSEEQRSASRASVSSHHSEATNHSRPRGPARLSTSKEETTLEKIWGQLFDEQGHSTARLGQFLRGLAIHLIEDYEPRHSLVVTPPKMVRFYQDVALSNELFPWNDVFDDDQTAISRLYRELGCSHHLVQERSDLRPDIPGLTPEGFERWATLMIKAYPEKEYERLQRAVLEMPISNPDDKKERFPKELSRRLFPGSGETDSSSKIEHAIAEHAHLRPARDDHDNTPKPTRTQSPPPPSKQPEVVVDNEPAYEPPYASNGIERERKPYSSIPIGGAREDCNPTPIIQPAVTQPIERERKPYAVQPGGGKLYEDELRKQPDDAARYGTNGKTYEDDLSATSRHRAASVAQSNPSSTRPISMAAYPGGKPLVSEQAPEVHHHGNPHLHRASVSTAQRLRRTSPSSHDYRRSETDLKTYPPPPTTHQTSNLSNSEHYENFDKPYRRPSFRDEGGRHYERGSRRATMDEEAINGAYGTPSRTTRYDPRYNGNEEEYYRRDREGSRGGYDYGAYGANIHRN